MLIQTPVEACPSWKVDSSDSDSEIVSESVSLRQLGQYHGAGVLTGLGLRLRHLAQR